MTVSANIICAEASAQGREIPPAAVAVASQLRAGAVTWLLARFTYIFFQPAFQINAAVFSADCYFSYIAHWGHAYALLNYYDWLRISTALHML